MTEIIGAPDIYVDRGSTLNVTCAVAAGSKEPEFIMWSRKQKGSGIMIFKAFSKTGPEGSLASGTAIFRKRPLRKAASSRQ